MAGIQLKCGHYSLNVSSTAVAKKTHTKKTTKQNLAPSKKNLQDISNVRGNKPDLTGCLLLKQNERRT